MTDHFAIEFGLNFPVKDKVKEKAKNPYTTIVHEYNTANADDEDWMRFEDYLNSIDEEAMLNDLDCEDQIQRFYSVVEEATKVVIALEVVEDDVGHLPVDSR